ncbi:hypothetical protein HK096_011620 [Nowakowskiella sp. JEL0078]|nr:hypothetical protein HK096_011620 [Nowakowskiella sp. JEL0078]
MSSTVYQLPSSLDAASTITATLFASESPTNNSFLSSLAVRTDYKIYLGVGIFLVVVFIAGFIFLCVRRRNIMSRKTSTIELEPSPAFPQMATFSRRVNRRSQYMLPEVIDRSPLFETFGWMRGKGSSQMPDITDHPPLPSQMDPRVNAAFGKSQSSNPGTPRQNSLNSEKDSGYRYDGSPVTSLSAVLDQFGKNDEKIIKSQPKIGEQYIVKTKFGGNHPDEINVLPGDRIMLVNLYSDGCVGFKK